MSSGKKNWDTNSRPIWAVKRTLIVSTVSYLHERAHKRELRLDTARQSTVIAQSQYSAGETQPPARRFKRLDGSDVERVVFEKSFL